MKMTKPGEVGEESFLEVVDGRPPIREHLVPFYELLIEDLTNPLQRAAAYAALKTRDQKATDAIIHAKDW
jgi:hypothetical protein